MRNAAGLMMLAVCMASGQEKRVLTLSLSRAVEIAMSPDGATRARLALEQVNVAEARGRQALGALMPNVDGSYTFRDFTQNLQAFGIQLPVIPGVNLQLPALVGPITVNDWRASAAQSIFDLAAIRRYQAAKAQVSAAKADEGGARNLVKGAVAKAYLNAVRADAALDTAKANVALAERVLKQAKSQKEAGTGTGIEVTRAEVVQANERQRMIRAAEERSAARLNLMRAMNVGLDAELELTGTLKYAPAEIPEAAKALEAARELRPELRAQSERERAARLSYESVKYERLPSANAFGDYGTVGKAGEPLIPTRAAGVQVRIPLWDGGRRDARRTESAALLRQEGIRARDTAQQVELEIRLALEALKSAESQVAVALEAMAQSEKELAHAQRRYEAGVSSGLEVTDAQTRVARAREENVLAVFRQKAARVDLGVAVGNIDLVIEN
ncbi:MAG: TolC family protein [Candidatus Solibacter usitatus]|nr:TolC family protein [Candidatus Solibacter usitatus]